MRRSAYYSPLYACAYCGKTAPRGAFTCDRHAGMSRDSFLSDMLSDARDAERVKRERDMSRNPGVPVGECSHGHANCSRH